MAFSLRKLIPSRRNVAVNALGADPALGGLPKGQGGYTPAPYSHPWTGNLVRHPPGLLNPVMNPYSSYKLGFERGAQTGVTFRVNARGVIAPNLVQNIAFANGYALGGQFARQLTPLAEFASESPESQS